MACTYSVIVPAYNEEEFLPNTLESLRRSMGEIEDQGEIIVVDNNSSDRTAEIARDYNARVVFEPVNQISRARNAGGQAAEGKFLIFLDADTCAAERLLLQALSNLLSGECCGGGAVMNFTGNLPWYYERTVDVWNFVSVKLGLAAGGFIYCLREGFLETGGFSEAVFVGEELWFSRKITAWGKKRGLDFRIITEHPALTSDRKAHWYSPLQFYGSFLLFIVFPFATRYRLFTRMWYRRPDRDS